MNIKDQYEELQGSFDTMEATRLPFQQSQLDSPLVDNVNNVPKWCYTTLKWLYPPRQPNQEGTWHFSEILQVTR